MRKLSEIKRGVSLPEMMFADQIVTIDKKLTEIATHIDDMDIELHRFVTSMDITKLLKHIVDETGKPVKTKLQDVPEDDFYSTVLANVDRFKYILEELRKIRQRLFTMRNSNILDKLSDMAKALNDKFVPKEKGKTDVITLLIADTVELIEILEQAQEEVKTFDAICKLVQNFPEEDKNKIQYA